MSYLLVPLHLVYPYLVHVTVRPKHSALVTLRRSSLVSAKTIDSRNRFLAQPWLAGGCGRFVGGRNVTVTDLIHYHSSLKIS